MAAPGVRWGGRVGGTGPVERGRPMPWEARYLAAKRLVESSYSGHVAPEEWNVRILGDRDRALAWLDAP